MKFPFLFLFVGLWLAEGTVLFGQQRNASPQSVGEAQAATTSSEAELTIVRNQVYITPVGGGTGKKTPAKVKDRVTGSEVVSTGAKSQAELKFKDQSLARLGQYTVFSFKQGKRDFTLNHGSALFNISPASEPAHIRTAAVTAAITGTTLLVQSYNGYEALFVYEGSVRIGDVVLTAGQVFVVQDGKPVVYSFDVKKGSQTSSLFTTFDDESSQSTFETAINEGQVIGQIPPGPPENRIDQTIENAVLNKDVKQDLPPPPPPPVEEPPPPPL